MNYIFRRSYLGPVRAVVFDMAGTVVDHGSRAPAGAFVELFRREGIEITMAQARAPMGLQKKDHVRAIARMPDVAARWREARGRECSEDDVEAMYRAFVPLQIEALPRHGAVIAPAVEVVEDLRRQGVKVALATGYSREMMEVVLRELSRQGLEADAAVCAGDVPAGRPAPWMIYRAMERLDVFPAQSVVKIGDTVPDIEEGLNAGVWSVGVVLTGNMLGLSEEELASLPEPEREDRAGRARAEMARAGAHYIIDGVGDVLEVVEAIEARLAAGETP
jgi:phosphonoacetaldehyde hydrolase